jgi:hypothetical protein
MKTNQYDNFDKLVLLEKIKKAERSYPDGHPQLKAIAEQKRNLIERYPELQGKQ